MLKKPQQLNHCQMAAQTSPPYCILQSKESISYFPLEVHVRMEGLAAMNAIPVTSLEQRKRNHRVPNTDYGVPQWLAEALRYGYVGPNLRAPAGYVWKATTANEWQLHVKGG